MLNMDDSHSYSNNIHKRLFDNSQTSKKTSHNKSLLHIQEQFKKKKKGNSDSFFYFLDKMAK